MKKYLFIFVACSLLLCCHSGQEEPNASYKISCGCGNKWPQEKTVCQRELHWDYPVKPGTAEWEQLGSYQERRNACQIPADVLSSLSTEDLMDICMLNPFLRSDVTIYGYNDRGLDSLVKKFNGVRELLQRDDASKWLLNWYRCAMKNPLLLSDAPISEKGELIANVPLVELLFTRYHSPNDKKEDYREMVQHLICGYEKMLMHPELFTCWDLGINLFSRVRLLVKIDEQNLEKIPQKENNGIYLKGDYCPKNIDGNNDDQTRTIIDELSCQLIN